MSFQRFLCSVLCCTALASCAMPQGYSRYHQKSVPVVSASRGAGEYISREDSVSYKEYVSALEEAKKESSAKSQPSYENPIDEFIAGLGDEDAIEYESLEGSSLSSLWGKPLGSIGEGVTIMNLGVRKRFNDALSTTPVGSQAKWRSGESRFIFMPNSDVYQPYYSGGNCRDGVFVNLSQGREEKVRGLFCQKGRGADWFYIR
ncbi:MAG: hypothetical protein CMF60_04035 [Magnetococcales bacterium]|nr:hypothetical protein [Magnetococcales bacterium]